MNMRHGPGMIAVLAFGSFFAQPPWARTWPKLIREGKDLLAKDQAF
jgi:hypothetical protein